MKDWWMNLSLRDKQIYSSLSVVIFLSLIYMLVWSPLEESADHLRQSVKSNITLLRWMEGTDAKIRALQKQAQPVKSDSASLLSLTQSDLNQQSFARNILQIEQSEGQSVQVRFQNVNFDDLLKWLVKFTQAHSVLISAFTATSTSTPGIVDAELHLDN